ncbi:MAG: PHP domain-containing protein [Eubacteriaceae bacterium]
MEYADLHIHSNYSDGKLSVEQIINYANDLNLKSISITDHDTIAGTVEALKINNSNVEIIPGVEFSTTYNNEDIHILGYLFNIEDPNLKDYLMKLQINRKQRAKKTIEKFKSIGIVINEKDLKRNDDNVIGRPHFAQVLVDKGYADNFAHAFNKYLIPGKPCFVAKRKISPIEVISLLKKIGGISTLAHPGLIKNQSVINDIIDMKIDAVEVYHFKHNSSHTRNYYSFAKKNKLLITGGSDCHSSHPSKKPFIGSIKIPYDYIKKLKEKRSEI